MKTWWVLCAVVIASCTPSAGAADEARKTTATTTTTTSAYAAPASATVWQSSYDAESRASLDGALAELDRLPAAEQGTYLAQLRRGWLLVRLGKDAEAIDAYARATQLEPASIEARLGVLPALANLRRWRDVETTARQVLERDASSYAANLRLAYALYSLGRFTEAEVIYRKLGALYPGDLEVRSGVGWSLLKLGKKREAATAFASILDVAPRHASALEGIRASR